MFEIESGKVVMKANETTLDEAIDLLRYLQEQDVSSECLHLYVLMAKDISENSK